MAARSPRFLRSSRDALWVLASALLAIAGIAIIVAQIGVAATGSLTFWHSVFFPDLESISAFVAAAAAWVAVMANRRSRGDGSRPHGPANNSGLSDNQAEFLHELMERLASSGKLSDEQAILLGDLAARLSTQPVTEIDRGSQPALDEEDETIKIQARTAVNRVIEWKLSPKAIELLRLIVQGQHLTDSQYLQLLESPVTGNALTELRAINLIVPLYDHDNRVFWLTREGRSIAYALLTNSPSYPSIAETIFPVLEDVGYVWKPPRQAPGSSEK
jgi:hypothetical protein